MEFQAAAAAGRCWNSRRILRLFDVARVKHGNWGYGATAACLTPDQKVGSSNLSALIFVVSIPVLMVRL